MGETSSEGNPNGNKENSAPVMGNIWQKRMKGKCLPRAQKKPRFVIPFNKLEEYNSYMKDHALICKFIGYWPSEKELNRWIEQRWKPRGHIDLKLGAQGFFTAVFTNLEDKNRIFEEGPYFLNNAGLFMKHWEERYNPEKEKLMDAPVWVRLFGLPDEFWDPEILEGIGNSIGSFVKTAEATRRGKYNAFARICVFMNLAEPLPENIELEYHDEVWTQALDYEHIPFRCRKCHEYGHLYRNCPLNKEEGEKPGNERAADTEEGFQQVYRKKRPNKENLKPKTQETSSTIKSQNQFQVLQDNAEGYEVNLKDDEDPENSPMEVSRDEKEKAKNLYKPNKEQPEEKETDETMESHMEVENQIENEAEEEKLMKRLLQEWKYLDSRFIPEKQKQLFKEAFQKYKERKGENLDKQITEVEEQQKEVMELGNAGKSSRKRGRRTLNETIQSVGETLINSGKVIPLSEVFFPSLQKF